MAKSEAGVQIASTNFIIHFSMIKDYFVEVTSVRIFAIIFLPPFLKLTMFAGFNASRLQV